MCTTDVTTALGMKKTAVSDTYEKYSFMLLYLRFVEGKFHSHYSFDSRKIGIDIVRSSDLCSIWRKSQSARQHKCEEY